MDASGRGGSDRVGVQFGLFGPREYQFVSARFGYRPTPYGSRPTHRARGRYPASEDRSVKRLANRTSHLLQSGAGDMQGILLPVVAIE